MPEQDTGVWVPLKGRDLAVAVREILTGNPERHQQKFWIANVFPWAYEQGYTYDKAWLPADLIRGYAMIPIPETPENPGIPVCGSTGCAAGWTAILAAPAGTIINNQYLRIPGKRKQLISRYAEHALRIRPAQAEWLFASQRPREEVIWAYDTLIRAYDTPGRRRPDISAEAYDARG